MKRLSVIFLLLIFFILPSFAFASCNCWCETSGGAEEKGSVADIATCQSTCDDFLGCYTDEQQSMNPDYNTLCWSQFECESQPIEFDGGVLASEWDGQASFCPVDKGYCYSEPQPINLNIAIGSLTEATSIGEYINAAYSWLLTAASLLAIVVMMIGGIEYILARGDKGKIGTATNHLKQATTGIVLLFASYAIANTIDPHFTTFNRLQPPRIRTVVFLDESSTCEVMASAGLIITPEPTGYKNCGYKGTVTAFGNQQVSIEIGTKCTYSKCIDANERCVSSTVVDDSEGVAAGYACIRCVEAKDKGATPSEAMCGELEVKDTNPNDGLKYFCEYDAGFLDAGVLGTQCVEIVYPEDEYNDYGGPSNVLNCDTLRADAAAGDSESCRFYDEVKVGYYSFELFGENIDYNEVDDVEGDNAEFPFLDLICSADPCGLAPPGERCQMAVSDADEIAYLGAVLILIPEPVTSAAGAALVALSLVTDELIANCANTSAIEYYGLWGCKDKNGNSIDCNPTW